VSHAYDNDIIKWIILFYFMIVKKKIKWNLL